MTEEYPIFTAAELMVLLGVSGGSALHGFWTEPASQREILQAAHRLSKRGLLTLETEGFRVADSQLSAWLAPLRRPRRVVLLTPLAEDQPQVCFAFGDGAAGYESVLVQPGAVRLFPFAPSQWTEELRRRHILLEMDAELPASYGREQEVTADFALPIQTLAAQWRHVTALLEYRTVDGPLPEKKVLMIDGPEDIRAVVVTKDRSWVSDDALAAVALAPREREETP